MGNIPCQRCSFNPELEVTAKYVLTLPVAAVSQNRLAGRNAHMSRIMYTRLRNKYEAEIAPRAKDIPPAKGKRRVTFTRVYRHGVPGQKNQRPYDTDNVIAGFKGARDVLTRLGLLIDDTAAFLEAHYEQRPGASDHVEITLEDVAWT